MSDRALIEQFRGLVCDLDGVVYAGPKPIAGAADALNRATSGGQCVIYATNNASRTAAEVATQLRDFGITLADDDVLTSSLAGARVLADALPAGTEVLVIGGAGVGHAVRAVGLTPVLPAQVRQDAVDKTPAAVLQGYGPQVTAADLAEAAYAVQHGSWWVATNTDTTLPTDRGFAPGNGTLINAVRAAVAVEPQVIGKPGPVMYDLAVQATSAQPAEVLGVGDRLETDIEGAHAAGLPAALVLTGVHGAAELIAAPPLRRPEFVLADLGDLHLPYAHAEPRGSRTVTCDGAVAQLVSSAAGARPATAWSLVVRDPAAPPEGLRAELLRAAAHILWAAIDDQELTPDAAVEVWHTRVVSSAGLAEGTA